MDPFLGFISAFGFNYPPRDWALCQGQLVNISQYQSLFALLGVTYGGNGRTNFACPDLRGRTPIGQGQGYGLSTDYHMGMSSVRYNQTLDSSSLATHSHAATFDDTGAAKVTATFEASQKLGVNEKAQFADYLAVGNADATDLNKNYVSPENKGATVSLGGIFGADSSVPSPWAPTVTLGAAGGNAAGFSLMQPSLAINYSIALQGIYPTRN